MVLPSFRRILIAGFLIENRTVSELKAEHKDIASYVNAFYQEIV